MDKEYLIQEKPLKALLIFAFPMIIGNLFQQFYTMVDSVVVGRFVSEHALAAVGASYSLTNVFISIAIGGGVGASVLTSRYFGSREYRKMKTSVTTAMLSFLMVSLILGGIGLFFGQEIMELLNTPENILEQATEYLNIYFLGLPFLFMYNILSAMFNALGRSKIPLYLLIFSSVFNIVLDVVFVREFHMGVAGVAWATLIAQGISAVVAFLLFVREMKQYQGEKGDTRFDKEEFSRMSRIALPSILQQSTVSIGMMLVQSVVNSFGAEMLAGFSAAMRIESICIVPMAAMGNVMSSFTAQNLGAGKQERVVKGYHTGYGIVFGFGMILCVILEFFYQPLIGMFLGEEGTALAMSTGTDYLRFIGWFFTFIGLKMITDGLLRGAGDMKMFTVANLVNLSIRVIMAVTLAPVFGIAMVWYAVPVGWAANYVISFLEYRTGKWRKKVK
ncbi:MAG: MATE family efflux transporter [Blautia sp.]|nr:MATE family efflux transporter [Blautia sp.]